MEENERTTEIRLIDFWNIFKRCWYWILIAMIVVGAGDYAWRKFRHVDKYTAYTNFYVLRDTTESGQQQSSSGTTTSDISIANYLIHDCKLLFLSEDNVLRPVLEETGLSSRISTGKLESMISFYNEEDTHILYMTVTADTPEECATLANEIADCATEYFNGLQGRKIVSIVDVAKVPRAPSNPVSLTKPMLYALIAGVLVYAAFFVLHLMDDKINDEDDVEKYLGLSLLGDIPNREDSSRRRKRYGYGYGYGTYDSGYYSAQGGDSAKKGK